MPPFAAADSSVSESRRARRKRSGRASCHAAIAHRHESRGARSRVDQRRIRVNPRSSRPYGVCKLLSYKVRAAAADAGHVACSALERRDAQPTPKRAR